VIVGSALDTITVFNYDKPNITAVTPLSGASDGGELITIDGVNFGTWWHACRHSHTHTHTHGYRYRYRYTETQTHTEIERQTHTHADTLPRTPTHTNTERHTS